MKSILLALTVIAFTGTAMANVTSLDSLPSATLRNALKERGVNGEELINSLEETETRERLFKIAWYYARNEPNADDLPYLFSLAMDMYNSLGPESNKCKTPPDENSPEYPCGKGQLWHDELHIVRNYLEYPTQLKEGWSRPNKAEIGAPSEDWYYVFYKAFENRTLAGPEDAASVEVSQIDMRNPTGYAELKRWMAATKELREKGVPPWEAIKQVPKYSETSTSPAPATTQAVAVTNPAPPTNAQSESPDSETTGVTQAPHQEEQAGEQKRSRWPLYVVIGLVLAALVAFFVLRKRK